MLILAIAKSLWKCKCIGFQRLHCGKNAEMNSKLFFRRKEMSTQIAFFDITSGQSVGQTGTWRLAVASEISNWVRGGSGRQL